MCRAFRYFLWPARISTVWCVLSYCANKFLRQPRALAFKSLNPVASFHHKETPCSQFTVWTLWLNLNLMTMHFFWKRMNQTHLSDMRTIRVSKNTSRMYTFPASWSNLPPSAQRQAHVTKTFSMRKCVMHGKPIKEANKKISGREKPAKFMCPRKTCEKELKKYHLFNFHIPNLF